MILQKVQYPDERVVIPTEARKIPYHNNMCISPANFSHHKFQPYTVDTIAAVPILRSADNNVSPPFCFLQQVCHLRR